MMKKDSNRSADIFFDILFGIYIVFFIVYVVTSIVLAVFVFSSRSDNSASAKVEVAVNKMLCVNDVSVISESELDVNSTTTINGTWVFNESVNTYAITGGKSYRLNFTSNGTNFIRLMWENDTILQGEDMGKLVAYRPANDYNFVSAYMKSNSSEPLFTGWQNEAYRTIVIDGEQTVDMTLYNFISSNATQTDPGETSPTQLSTPVLTWSNNILSWTASANASSYTLYKDGEKYAEDIVGVSYTPTVSGSYQIMAVGDGTDYSNSELSAAVVVTISEPTTPIQLDAPVLTWAHDHLAWLRIPHALSYTLYKDGGIYLEGLSGVDYVPVHSGSYQIMAIGDGTDYLNSDLSNAVSVTAIPQLPAPAISLNDSGYITWPPVKGAISYGVYRDGSLVATLTDSTFLYAPPVPGTYYVVANANGNTATSSLASNSVVVSSTPSNPAFNDGYEQGFNDGYDIGVAQGFTNPLTIFVRPINSFLTTDFFGVVSIGDIMQVLLFICLALIFLRMFAGG